MRWIGLAVILVPVAIAATFAAIPLWSWIETTYEIESIGHSGPAGWCYTATYILSLVGAAAVSRLRMGRRR